MLFQENSENHISVLCGILLPFGKLFVLNSLIVVPAAPLEIPTLRPPEESVEEEQRESRELRRAEVLARVKKRDAAAGRRSQDVE